MTKINLPRKFKDKLRDMQELEGIVISTVSDYGDILADNKPYFFEEYTDHGAKHIESILESTANLATVNTLNNVLSGKDIACFILSTLLHDIAMHISPDGFNQLLNGQFDDIRVQALDKHTWSQLWKEYLNEAKKFSSKQLVSIFGNQHTIIREPPLLNKAELNGNDKKLIGEFIRRHHARLAHEIALKGFPGKDNPLQFAEGLDHRHKQLIGLIARSHGLDLRICMDYVESAYGIKTRKYINGIHIIFLMILLRLADYLQIDNSRTSGTLLKLKTFASPFSENEHHTHLAIDYIDSEYQNDPERIFVHASPEDSSMYLKIRHLLQDIQHEFDMSWAVLGELYGNMENKPEIKYRRISSNLQEESFHTQQVYVPDTFHFRSNTELIKLLIAPLYGNDPRYGVRELLQNALDACKERKIHEKKGQHDYKEEIEIRVSKEPSGDTFFEIRDNGVGMTVTIIKDYFLTAGASYRNSFEWQKTFTDAEGSSIVNRSGQFGVGVLAAFLIGQHIYVETRNIHTDTGYKFFADLDRDQINVLKDDAIKIGTFVRIKIDHPDFDLKDAPNWTKLYVLSQPSIRYYYLGTEITTSLPLGPDPQCPNEEWRSLDSKGYNKIFWTYDTLYARRSFTCNGIIMAHARYSRAYLDLFPFETPNISVIDNSGLLPISLDRSELSGPVSFEKDLLEDICKDFLAYLLLFTPPRQVKGSTISLGSYEFKYPGFQRRKKRHYWVSKNGFLLAINFLQAKAHTINKIEINVANLSTKSRRIELDLQDAFFSHEFNSYYSSRDVRQELIRLADPQRKNLSGIKEDVGTRIFLRKEQYDQLFETQTDWLPAWVKDECKIEFDMHGILSLSIGNPNDSLIDESFLKKYSKNIIFIKEQKNPMAYLPYVRPSKLPNNIIPQLVEKYLGNNVVIPYSIEDRRELYPLAFEELEYYMRKYQERIQFQKDPDPAGIS